MEENEQNLTYKIPNFEKTYSTCISWNHCFLMHYRIKLLPFLPLLTTWSLFTMEVTSEQPAGCQMTNFKFASLLFILRILFLKNMTTTGQSICRICIQYWINLLKMCQILEWLGYCCLLDIFTPFLPLNSVVMSKTPLATWWFRKPI